MDLKNKGVLVFTYFSYHDPLIQTYTLPYVRLIRKHLAKENALILVCLEKEDKSLFEESEELKKEGIDLVWFKYNGSGIKAAISWVGYFAQLFKLLFYRKIKVIHAWCTPAGAFAYILTILGRKKLIIDSYEPHAEAMVENGTWPKGNLLFRILFKLEKLQTEKASVLIAATEGMAKYAKEKYGLDTLKKTIYVKPACVNLELFSHVNLKRHDLLVELGFIDKVVCVYAGKFGGIYQEKEVFDFFKVAHKYWGDKFRVLLLTGHDYNEIAKWCEEINLNTNIFVVTRVLHHKIPDYIGLGDFAITPVKPVATKRYCTPIKNGEYWALGLPVVIPANISDDSDIIKKYDIGAVLDELNDEAYLKAVEKIDSILLTHTKDELYDKIRAVAEKYRNFAVADKIYQEIYS